MSKNESKLKNIKSIVRKKSFSAFFSKNCFYSVADSREILRDIPDSYIDCIITSPPYGALKNYGSKTQLGYGQNTFSEYLPDLTKVLGELFRVTKDGGALWLILDNLKENGKGIPLPWEVMNRAVEMGWSFHDIVVWDKGRSLPWSHNGKFRGVCEYILLLGKGKLKQFDLDSARDAGHLSWYWVKYPERYNPDGKAPSDLWHFPIPVQGSWSNGKKQSRHFCPFPLDLVARMLNITTSKGELVLDPFAGTGSVITTASYMDRYGLGIDVNKDFYRVFRDYGYNSYIARAKEIIPKDPKNKNTLRKTIINLRILKYAKTLFSQLSREDRLNSDAKKQIGLFLVKLETYNNINSKRIDTLNLAKIGVDVLLNKDFFKKDVKDLVDEIKNLQKIPPLSKYGLDVNVNVVPYRTYTSEQYINSLSGGKWYLYKNAAFYKYSEKFDKRDLVEVITNEVANNKYRVPAIMSNVEANVTLPVSD